MSSVPAAPGIPRSAHLWPVMVIALLLPLWLVGILDRQLWTPDEPRVADIAWHMSMQSNRTLPRFAGAPFLEKPPLSYWAEAAAIRMFGDSPAAARLPNLLYAVIAALAIGALAFAMAGADAAVTAAIVAGSGLIVLHVTLWLAPDACLFACCTLALFGAYLGYSATDGVHKLAGYTLMHLGAALGFMAKSAPGWLVPALALFTLIAWERRWRELRCWQLYAGLVLQALIIGPWIAAVAREPDGIHSLRVLFWYNDVGRFVAVGAPLAYQYTLGHKNWPGKYLLELASGLLPWTLVVIAALRRAWRKAREPGVASTPWRFAVTAALPFLALLCVAATARGIYAAPAVIGMGLLVALWAQDPQRPLGRFDTLALRGTRALVGLIALILAVGVGLLIAAGEVHGSLTVTALLLILAAAAVIVMLRLAALAQRRQRIPRSIAWTYAAHAAALAVAAVLVFPAIDRWHDLPALARQIHRDTAGEDLALLRPDETTMAMLDHRLQTPYVILAGAPDAANREVAAWFRAHPRRGRVLVKMPGLAPGRLTHLLARWHRSRPAGAGLAGSLAAAGVARIAIRYHLPQGRRYALLEAPLPMPPARVNRASLGISSASAPREWE